ncbi:MAG: phytoene desaturase family protein [Candidatus Helarchaeota archaeon]
MKKRVIIIGSGVGGSAIGALLQHHGNFDVTIFEKNKLIGGRYATYEKKKDDGTYKLDIGCHMIANCDNGTMGTVLKKIGRPKAVQWSIAKNPAPIFHHKGKRIKFPVDFSQLDISEDEASRLQSLMNEIMHYPEEKLQKLEEEQVDVGTFLARYTKNRKVFPFFFFYVGMELVVPDNFAAASEWIRCHGTMARNDKIGYPVGGSGAIPTAYCRSIEEDGGKVELKAPVERILVENNEARGVKLKDGTIYSADIVISNAGLKHTVLELVGKDYFAEEFVERVNQYMYSLSTYQIKIALDEKITDEKMIMIPGDYVFMPMVSNLDPSLCPDGKQIIIAGASCPNVAQGFDPAKHDSQMKEAILRSVKKVLPEIEDHVMWIDVASPNDIEKLVGEDGNVIGIAQTINQVGKNRPKQELPIKNLYCCCADTGLHGIGGELAADSALRLYEKLVN